MIEDDEEADSGPMPLLVDCLLADLNARHEAQQQVLAQSRAVSKQMDDALQAQMLRMARAVEERRKARDKYEADWAVASALSLLAKIERTTSVEAVPETLSSPRSVAMPTPYVAPLPLLHVMEATPKPSHVENVAATDNDDDKPIVEDVRRRLATMTMCPWLRTSWPMRAAASAVSADEGLQPWALQRLPPRNRRKDSPCGQA